MATTKQKNTAIFQMLACAALWSTGGILIKLIPWNAFVITGIRSFFSAGVVAIYMYMAKMPVVFTKKSMFTGVSLWLTFSCFVAANKLTTAANAIVLQFTAPVFIMLFSAVFMKRKFRPADIITVILTLGGISLFFLDQISSGHILGNVIAILSGALMACMYIGVGAGQGAERMSGLFIANSLAFLAGIPFMIVTKPVVSPLPVLYIVILGVFQLGIAYILFAKAAEYCPPLACSLLGAVEPLLNPVWVYLFDGEAPGFFALIGGVIVIITITCWCVYDGRKAEAEAK